MKKKEDGLIKTRAVSVIAGLFLCVIVSTLGCDVLPPSNVSLVADDQSIKVAYEMATEITLSALDLDGDSLAFFVDEQPGHGVLSGESILDGESVLDGESAQGGGTPKITYIPDDGYTGPDSFSFHADDGTFAGNVATVTILVNSPPEADDQTIIIPLDTPTEIMPVVSDDDGDTLDYIIEDLPEHGVLSGGTDTEELVYTPDQGYLGPDGFTFRANDGLNESDVATVSIVVNAAPVVDDQYAWTRLDTSVEIILSAWDPGGDTITYLLESPPEHGILRGSTPFLTYIPDPGYSGGDSFTLYASDGRESGEAATINIMVGVWFVDDDAKNQKTGKSWQDAFKKIKDAIRVARPGEKIFVAQGTYTGNSNAVLTMKDGVDIYGSFEGDEDSLSERGDPAGHPSTLDARNYNFHVVIGASDARLDGFILTGGKAYYSRRMIDKSGAGIYNLSVTGLEVANCIISDNSASGSGGGIYNEHSEVTITNCSLINNSGHHGGGIYNYKSESTVTDSSLINNSAVMNGGGLYNSAPFKRGFDFNDEYIPIVTGTSFIGNSAAGDGGAMFVFNTTAHLDGCLFEGNSATGMGGGIYFENQDSNIFSRPSASSISDSKFVGNSSGAGGGAIAFIFHSFNIFKTDFISNTTVGSGGAIHTYRVDGGGGLVRLMALISNCIFSNNSATAKGGAIYKSIPSEYRTVRSTFYGNSSNNGGVVWTYDSGRHRNYSYLRDSILWQNSAPTYPNITITISLLSGKSISYWF